MLGKVAGLGKSEDYKKLADGLHSKEHYRSSKIWERGSIQEHRCAASMHGST